MIDKVILDTDGVIIQREMYFSERLSKELNISLDLVLPFFKLEFKDCLIGRLDTKVALDKYIGSWGWKGSVEQLLQFWFQNESNIDSRVLEVVEMLKSKGRQCYLDTNNEKYRTAYLRNDLGLGKVFTEIFSSSAVGYAKPAMEFWAAIYQQLGKPATSSVLVWDDEEETVKSARDFGFQAELYTGFKEFEVFMKSRKLL
jgi:putative hydrolase of the HAD superfamily